MAATVTQIANDIPGNRRQTVTTVTFDNSYPTGGLPVTAKQLGLGSVDFAHAQVSVAGTGSVTAVFYDIANQKLKAFTAAAEVANATDLSAVSAQIIASGRSIA